MLALNNGSKVVSSSNKIAGSTLGTEASHGRRRHQPRAEARGGCLPVTEWIHGSHGQNSLEGDYIEAKCDLHTRTTWPCITSIDHGSYLLPSI